MQKHRLAVKLVCGKRTAKHQKRADHKQRMNDREAAAAAAAVLVSDEVMLDVSKARGRQAKKAGKGKGKAAKMQE